MGVAQNLSNSSPTSLKDKIKVGGFHLALRYLFTTALSLLNIFIVARVLGAESYGVFAISISYFLFTSWMSKLGLTTFVVRQQNLSQEGVEMVLLLSFLVGILSSLLVWFCAPYLSYWTGNADVKIAFRCFIPAIMLDNIGRVSFALLERNLKFSKIGFIEVVSQTANYCITIPLVLMGSSYIGPIIGVSTQCFLLTVLSIINAPIALNLRWDWAFLKQAFDYSITYIISDFILSLRRLIIPTLIGHFISIEAVGTVSIAVRFAEQLTVLRSVIKQMSISVMAKILDEKEKISRALSEGMVYQILMVAPVCALFACVSSWLVPMLFGHEWLISTKIFPFVALGVIIQSVFELHISTLYADGSNIEVIKLNIIYVGILWVASCIFLPLIGVFGYAIAMIAATPSFLIVHRSFSARFGRPDYKVTLYIGLASLPPLFLGPFIEPFWALIVFGTSYLSVIIFSSELRKMITGLTSRLLNFGLLKRSKAQ